MKKLPTIILLAITQITISQTTEIPDSFFEYFLEMEGLGDGIPNNGLVFTANINSVTELNIWEAEISDLTGIEDFTALETLDCTGNFLTTLDVSNNLNLWELDCGNNQITTLVANTNIESLLCYGNQLTSLDVSIYPQLDQLWCDENQIVSLDLSNNVNLFEVYCGDNNALQELNVKNGNNIEFLEILHAENTPNLTCIQVDDPVYSNAQPCNEFEGWCKDETAIYSEDCSLGLEDVLVTQITLYPNPVQDMLNIENNSSNAINAIKIYDVMGRLVLHKIEPTNQIDVSNLVSGILFVKIETNKGLTTKKIIKE